MKGGGLPALTRMTRLFYEKHVPQDPLLAPLFSNMSADHPQRVAEWLGEVFGGRSCYSEQYGGYPRMISQHVGKGLTEEWRARWVSLLLQSAREAAMPNDAEFAAAFQSYIEWGSRPAVENSQTNARPPEHMPMPHRDWSTGAGPPGGRISALAPETEADEPPVALPAADEPVRFEKHIKPLFLARARRHHALRRRLATGKGRDLRALDHHRDEQVGLRRDRRPAPGASTGGFWDGAPVIGRVAR